MSPDIHQGLQNNAHIFHDAFMIFILFLLRGTRAALHFVLVKDRLQHGVRGAIKPRGIIGD